MDAPKCLLRVQQQGEQALVRVEGRGSLLESPAIRAYGEKCLKWGLPLLALDLRHCTHMDSTFVGTLLFLHRRAEAARAQLRLISPSPACIALMEGMGVKDLFVIVDEPELGSSGWTLMDITPAEAGSLRSNIVQAHRELAQTPGLCGQQFMRVAECFREGEGGAKQ